MTRSPLPLLALALVAACVDVDPVPVTACDGGPCGYGVAPDAGDEAADEGGADEQITTALDDGGGG